MCSLYHSSCFWSYISWETPVNSGLAYIWGKPNCMFASMWVTALDRCADLPGFLGKITEPLALMVSQTPKQGASGILRACLDPTLEGQSVLYIHNNKETQPSVRAWQCLINLGFSNLQASEFLKLLGTCCWWELLDKRCSLKHWSSILTTFSWKPTAKPGKHNDNDNPRSRWLADIVHGCVLQCTP